MLEFPLSTSVHRRDAKQNRDIRSLHDTCELQRNDKVMARASKQPCLCPSPPSSSRPDSIRRKTRLRLTHVNSTLHSHFWLKTDTCTQSKIHNPNVFETQGMYTNKKPKSNVFETKGLSTIHTVCIVFTMCSTMQVDGQVCMMCKFVFQFDLQSLSGQVHLAVFVGFATTSFLSWEIVNFQQMWISMGEHELFLKVLI